jgi:hypothetical protein
MIILAMPAQYIQQSIESISSKIKNNVVILNLAK